MTNIHCSIFKDQDVHLLLPIDLNFDAFYPIFCTNLFADVICDDVVPDTTNLTVSQDTQTYLSTINYTCDTGHYFEFENRATFRTSVCNAREEWTLNDDQVCLRK